MRIVISVLWMLLCSSVSVAAERCFDAYAAEQDRTGLSYQSIIRKGNIARELSFQADRGLLSVLVFNENVLVDEVLKHFDLLLKAKYEAAELVQVKPERLRESFNFAQRLVFPSSLKAGRYETYLLFSEGNCHLIFRHESWSKSDMKFELEKLLSSARLFSVM